MVTDPEMRCKSVSKTGDFQRKSQSCWSLAKVFIMQLKLSLLCSRIPRLCKRGCRLAWSRLVDLGSIDPGSNPGNPTTPNIISYAFKLPSEKTSEGLLFCTNQTCGYLQHCNSVEEHRAISVS